MSPAMGFPAWMRRGGFSTEVPGRVDRGCGGGHRWAIAAAAVFLATATLSAEDPPAPGLFVMDAGEGGVVALDIRAPAAGHPAARLWWIFSEHGFHIAPDEGGGYRLIPETILDRLIPEPLAIRPDPKSGGFRIVEGGGVDGPAAEYLATRPLRPAADPPWDRLVAAQRERFPFGRRPDDVDAWLGALPANLVNPALRLLSPPDPHRFARLVGHPGVRVATLGSLARRPAGWAVLQAAVAAHPDTPDEALALLFEQADAPAVWRAASEHPRAPPEWAATYRERARRATGFAARQVVWDSGAPADVLAWVAEHTRDELILDSIARHANLSPEGMKVLWRRRAEERDVAYLLARRRDLPPDLLDAMIAQADPGTLSDLARNPSLPEAAASRVQDRLLAFDPHFVAKSPRLSEVQAERLVAHADPEVRTQLAGNPALAQAHLDRLTRDPYRRVAEPARAAWRNRFPGPVPNWPELEAPTPPDVLARDIAQAIRRRDLDTYRDRMAHARRIGAELPEEVAADALRVGDPAWVAPWTLPPAFPWGRVLNDLALREDWDDRHASRIAQAWSLDEPERTELMRVLLEMGRNTAVVRLLGEASDPETPIAHGGDLLEMAVRMRAVEVAEALVRRGVDPSRITREGYAPVDLAAVMASPALVRLLDTKGRYAEWLDQVTRTFPPAPKSPALGTWTAGAEHEQTWISLFGDGSGILVGAGGMTGMSIGWRHRGAEVIEIAVVRPPVAARRMVSPASVEEEEGEEIGTSRLVFSGRRQTLTLREDGHSTVFRRPEPEDR